MRLSKILLWTLLTSTIITLLTMKNQAAVDGISSYGFPFTFFDYSEGKMINSDDYATHGFKLLSLLADLVIVAVVVVLIKKIISNFITNRYFKR